MSSDDLIDWARLSEDEIITNLDIIANKKGINISIDDFFEASGLITNILHNPSNYYLEAIISIISWIGYEPSS